MKMGFSKKTFLKILKDRVGFILYLVIFIIIAWVCYFTYQNIYLVVISPKDINQNEIIAKKQKVDLELFNTISHKINDKKDASDKKLQEIKNPFE